jgi:histidine decarboxylase
VLNLGSTYRGAHDNVPDIVDRLKSFLKPRALIVDGKPETRNNYWIHIDGALGATYLPFLEWAYERDLLAPSSIPPLMFDFRVPQVSSIVTSGHKYPGAPWACGIYMTRSELQLKPPKEAEYVSSPDTTFGGSRNGFSPIVLWNNIAKHSDSTQVEMIAACMKLAQDTAAELEKTLQEVAKKDAEALKGHASPYVERTPHSLSIVFPRPRPKIVKEFSLANVTVEAKGPDKGTVQKSHLFVMPHVNKDRLDKFLARLRKPEAFWPTFQPPPETEEIDAVAASAWPENIEEVLQISMNRGFS